MTEGIFGPHTLDNAEVILDTPIEGKAMILPIVFTKAGGSGGHD